MREEGAKSVCGPKITDQIVFKGRVRKLGCVLDSLWVFLFVKFLKLSLIKLLWSVYIVEVQARQEGEGDGPVEWEGVRE
jgi:hypothetical protein